MGRLASRGRNKGNNMDMTFGQSAVTKTPAASTSSTFTRVINWCLALLVFLSPLLFLPFTSEVLEFNKQTFIFLMVMVVLGVWVIRILTTRSVSWVKTPLDYILLAYLAVYLIASFLSIDQISSFLGYYGRFTGSFFSILAFVVLYYVVVNNVRTERVTRKLLDILMISGAVVLVYSLLQIFGVHILPFSFAKSTSFNPVGSLVSLSIFSVLMILLVQWSWLTRSNSKIKNALYVVMTLAALLIIFFVNSFIAWLVLALAMMAFMALSMVMIKQDTAQTWLWKPLLILVVSILFVAFNFLPNSMNPRRWVGDMVTLPVEIQLSNSANWEMVKNSISEKPFLGFGPGTTGVAFSQIKPESINRSIVWSLNFDRASSEVANITIETGLLGLLAFEAASILFLLYALFFLVRHTEHSGRMYALGLFVVWLALYITHFFYFFNTTLSFMFWFSLAMFVAIAHWKQQNEMGSNMTFSNSPRSTVSWMFGSLIILAVLLVGGFFQIALYFGETAFASGLKELRREQPNLERASELFASAISRNQYRDTYFLAYGQTQVFLAAQEIRKEKPDSTKFQGWIANMIRSGNSATTLSPNKASNWSARVTFLNQIRALNIPGASDAIVQSAEEAAKRDAKSPVVQMQLAQAYANSSETIDLTLAAGAVDTDRDGLSDQDETALGSNPQNSDSNANGFSDSDEVQAGFNPNTGVRLTNAQLAKYTKIDQAKLQKAEVAFNEALNLKNDLPDAYIALGRLYEKWGKLPQAQTILEKGTQVLPSNVNIAYELGRILFNQQKTADAEKQFNKVVRLVPNHANAHYSLAVLAARNGDTARAITELEKTLEITGPNEQLQKELDALKGVQTGQ